MQLPSLASLRAQVRVVAFEPEPSNFRHLVRNVRAHGWAPAPHNHNHKAGKQAGQVCLESGIRMMVYGEVCADS